MNWVTYNDHDELVRAMQQIKELEEKVEVLEERLAFAKKTLDDICSMTKPSVQAGRET